MRTHLDFLNIFLINFIGPISRLTIVSMFAIVAATFPLCIGSKETNAAVKSVGKKVDQKPVRLLIIGDSLGGSLWIGIYQNYYGNRAVKIERRTKISSGIVRDDFYNWNKTATRFARRKKFDAVIMMIGGNDGQPIRVKGKRYRERVSTDLWRLTYGDRVEHIIKTFMDTGARVYWVGMPIQRRKKDNQVGKIINAIFAERAKTLGATYIDSYHMFAGPKGQYVTHLTDDRGKRTLMRDRDGMHFTTPGVVWLGRVVGKIIDADFRPKPEPKAQPKPEPKAQPKPDIVATAAMTPDAKSDNNLNANEAVMINELTPH